MTHGKNRGLNRTLNIRVNTEEIETARKLGAGNISQGFRMALRYAASRNMKPVKLSTMLRACVEISRDLEGR